jgi:hypothetical protein
MATAIELLHQGKNAELWRKCCGFIDLNMSQFMTIQHRLLLEQLELLNNCELGAKMMHGANPRTMEEFRKQVPVTTYRDYAPYLLEKREDTLPEKPIFWQWTSGRSGEYPHKWVPVTQRIYDEIGDFMIALVLFASCEKRGDVVIEEHDKFIYGVAPPPYASGFYYRKFSELDIFDVLPPIAEAEKMTFEERIQTGFKMALSEGMDIMGGLNSVLVTIGERLGQGTGMKASAALLKQPKMVLRMLRAIAKSKMARRPLLPKDIWTLKALAACGTDNAIYRDKIKYLWGRYPMDTYGSSESNLLATQTWDYETMTFLPQMNLLEFMPEKEWNKWFMDSTYRPELLLLDEVQPGETYAMVVTSFMGGAFIRYFLGDSITIQSLRNEKCDISLPQMTFDTRIDGIIDIAGFTRLTEKVVWQALENSTLAYQEWSIRKEPGKENPVLHLYIEFKPGKEQTEEQVATVMHQQLRSLDKDYANLEAMLSLKPLKVTVLPNGTFQTFTSRQRAAGADLAHLKPPHVNPTDKQIKSLLTPVA